MPVISATIAELPSGCEVSRSPRRGREHVPLGKEIIGQNPFLGFPEMVIVHPSTVTVQYVRQRLLVQRGVPPPSFQHPPDVRCLKPEHCFGIKRFEIPAFFNAIGFDAQELFLRIPEE
jgi:hypothetical protein